MHFSFSSKSKNCGIVLFDNSTGKEVSRIPFLDEDRMGFIYTKDLEIGENQSYLFWQDDRLLPDKNSKSFLNCNKYGVKRCLMDFRSRECTRVFDWENDKRPFIPYSEALFYVMHVRGFSMHKSAKVTSPGTFSAIIEKIAYLKEMGITSLELQPAYEFSEITAEFEKEWNESDKMHHMRPMEEEEKLNYWGYKEGYYYAPKAAYAAKDAVIEFKELIKALHQNRMELIMQFYFPASVKPDKILDILRFWVKEYHVDGFHLMGDHLPMEVIALDERLADSKIFFYHFDFQNLYEEREYPVYPHLGICNDAYMYNLRRFLKGDEAMLGTVLQEMRYIPEKAGRIHYLSNYSGFTLMDMVSYDHKHNEENGEENRDGSDYNCSWNCGEEGVSTRSKKIKRLRIKQLKNAMLMLLLSQSTPMIFMGDEFGNSQNGNNNPYCLDSNVTRLDWGLLEKNKEINDFWKMLVKFRKENPILHPEKSLKLMDTLSCGYPDLSYHGENAWRPQTDGYFRHIGIMYCGKYANSSDGNGFLYVAMNMHWDEHKVALPKLPAGMKWELAIQSFNEETRKISDNSEAEEENCKVIEARTIKVYKSVECDIKDKKGRKATKSKK